MRVVFVVAGCAAGSGRAPSRVQLRRPAITVANPWKVVSYHGVHLRVPATWPVIDAMHAPWCGDTFPATPTMYIGTHGNSDAQCPYFLPRGPGHDGVWLRAGRPPPGAWGDRVVRLWYRGVFVEIGIGPDRKVSREILRSIGYTRGRPDSKVADVCRHSAGPVRMPTPARVHRRLVIEHGNIMLAPPLRSDRAIMAAPAAWRESGPKSVFERYRLLLARYSSKYPAPNWLGSGVLAWVVYFRPFSAAIAGCGNWGVYGFDARTGQPMADDSWSPGP